MTVSSNLPFYVSKPNGEAEPQERMRYYAHMVSCPNCGVQTSTLIENRTMCFSCCGTLGVTQEEQEELFAMLISMEEFGEGHG